MAHLLTVSCSAPGVEVAVSGGPSIIELTIVEKGDFRREVAAFDGKPVFASQPQIDAAVISEVDANRTPSDQVRPEIDAHTGDEIE